MDGIEELKGVTVLAATNRIDIIDPALLRSGRFDLMFEVPLPDVETREKIFKIHTKNMPLGDDVNLKALAGKIDNMTGADIQFICQKAKMCAIREVIDQKISTENTDIFIMKKHFEKAIAVVLLQNSEILN